MPFCCGSGTGNLKKDQGKPEGEGAASQLLLPAFRPSSCHGDCHVLVQVPKLCPHRDPPQGIGLPKQTANGSRWLVCCFAPSYGVIPAHRNWEIETAGIWPVSCTVPRL